MGMNPINPALQQAMYQVPVLPAAQDTTRVAQPQFAAYQQPYAPVQEKKESIFTLKNALLAAGATVLLVAGGKTYNAGKAFEKALGTNTIAKGTEFKAGQTFLDLLNPLNWTGRADAAKKLEGFTAVNGTDGRILTNGSDVVIINGKKVRNVKDFEEFTPSKDVPPVKPEAPVEQTSIATAQITAKSGIPENLQKAWNEVIPQIQKRDTETAFVHNMETGEKITEATVHGEISTDFSQEGLQEMQKASDKKQKLAMIHNHIADTTFSSKDLLGIANPKSHYDVMGVVTKGGGIGIFKKAADTSKFSAERIDKNIATIHSFMGMEIGLAAKLRANNASDLEIFKTMEKLRQENLPKIGKQLGYDYTFIPPKTASTEIFKYPNYDEEIKLLAQVRGQSIEEMNASLAKEDFFAPNYLESATDIILEIKRNIQAA